MFVTIATIVCYNCNHCLLQLQPLLVASVNCVFWCVTVVLPQVDLRYEDDVPALRLFGTASVEHMAFDVNIYPHSLALNARLGNVRVTGTTAIQSDHLHHCTPTADESLTPESLYYYVINIKEGGTDSLIVLDFASHTAQESLQEARVPDGAAYYTLEGHLSQLDVVFLHRFLQVDGA